MHRSTRGGTGLAVGCGLSALGYLRRSASPSRDSRGGCLHMIFVWAKSQRPRAKSALLTRVRFFHQLSELFAAGTVEGALGIQASGNFKFCQGFVVAIQAHE